MAKRAGDGKKLEGELGRALHHLGAWDYNSNDPAPACDRIVHWRWLPILLEAKETRDGKVEFRRFDGKNGRERRYLNWHAGLPDPKDDYPAPPGPSHGLTLVAIELVCARPRLWLAHWEDVVEIEQASPVKHLVVPPTDARFVEVFRVQRPNSLGPAWEVLPAVVRLVGMRPPRFAPEVLEILRNVLEVMA